MLPHAPRAFKRSVASNPPRTNYSRIKEFLETSGEGFFNRNFDPNNLVQSLRKGLLFNRKVARQDPAEMLDNRRLQEQLEAQQEEKRLMNCFLEDTCSESEEPVKKEERDTKIIKKKPKTEPKDYPHPSAHTKQSCFELKLSRDKWLTNPSEYCSGDFRKLQIELPQINVLSRTCFRNSSLDLKPQLSGVLNSLTFSLKPVSRKQSKHAKSKLYTPDGGLPKFLLKKLKEQSMSRRPTADQQSWLQRSLCKKYLPAGKSSYLIENDSTRWSINASQIVAQTTI